MATSGLYGSTSTGTVAPQSGSESVGLYGNNTVFGGSYFEYFIFLDSATAPATPTGGSWSFVTNVGTPPASWSNTPPASPTNKVWVSIALVNSKSTATLTWSVPGVFVVSGGTVTNVSALTLGTTGTDVSSTVANSTTTPVITLNLPTASATNRGLLNAADWTTFNSKGTGSVTSVSGTTGRVTSTGGTTPVIDLASGVATPGTTGSATLVPVVTIDTYGRVTSITTAANPQGTVTSVTGTAPVVSSGGTTPAISMAAATSSVSGYLTSTDWTTFNSKGSGTVTSVAATVPSFLSVAGSPITTSGTLALSYSGTALPVANGGTGVTASSGANSVVLRDANANITTNCLFEGFTSQAASGTTIVLTAASVQNYQITGSGGQVIRLPNATTLPNGALFTFNNNQSSGAITVQNNSSTTIATINSGGYVTVSLLDNTTAVGSWDRHDSTPANVSWSTNTLDYPGSITSATWNGVAVAINRGGTGQATQAAAITALAGTQASGQYLRSNGTNTLLSAIQAADVPTLNQNTTGTASNVTGTVAIVNGGTGLTSLTANQVHYGSFSQSANLTFDGTTLTAAGLAGPFNGSVGATTPAAGSFTSLAYSTTLTGGTGIVNLGSGQFYKDASGNVGIGTTSPSQKLTLGSGFVQTGNGIGGAGGVWFPYGGDAGSRSWRARTDNVAYGDWALEQSTTQTGTTFATKFLIDPNGNVGIGTTSPAGKLDVRGASYFGTPNTFIIGDDGGSLGAFFNETASVPMRFLTAGTEQMRIASGGDLLINTTSMPGSGNTRLGIVYTSGDGAGIKHTGSTGGAAPKVFDFVNSSNSSVGYIAVSGAATFFTSVSDYRLKENIMPMTGALAKVASMKPCTYTWKATPEISGQGFIAHELAEVAPDCVTGTKDAVDSDGNPRYQGVDTSFLVATLTAAIQEQQALITSLTARIAALEVK
jgi:hypothetical protein